ncbi:MAG: hydroxylamine reductase, partial [Saccharofermentanales bacterium]
MGMFCYQCQETAKNTGCTVRGVCGKTEDVAKLQDLLIYTMKGIGDIVVRGDIDAKDVDDVAGEVLNGLFMTITNANFDPDALEAEIRRLIDMRDQLAERVGDRDVHDAATFAVTDRASMLEKASEVGVLATEDEDIRSLRETITY